jgi:UDP-galactopyranose mutase
MTRINILFKVYIGDSGNTQGYNYLSQYWRNIDAWAMHHCKSYQGYCVQDVSDVSLQWDEIGEYRFLDEKDAMLFELKWN